MRALTLGTTLLLATAAGAQERRALDLPALIERAQAGPRVQMARAQARVAQARRDEVAATALPQGELTVLGAPSPEIRCVPSELECLTTEPRDVGLRFDGALVRIDARAVWPVYTFGKRSSGLRAAGAGVEAANALSDAAAADVMVDSARAYYGTKLGRELVAMLEEGRDILASALKRVEEELAQPESELGESDRRRLRVLQTEVAARLAEARKLERVAQGGVALLWGEPGAEVDAGPLEVLPGRLPPLEEALRAAAARPEVRAAASAARATQGLADVERARLRPDLAVVAQATLARAGGVDDPKNAFANDPFNTTSAGAGLALRWQVDVATRLPRVRAARAEAERAEAGARLALDAAQLGARQAWAEADEARGRHEAARTGEEEARAWLVSSLQAEAAGLADTKELGDALNAWFGQRARLAQATFDWNVSVFNLMRATGATWREAYALPR